MRSRQRETAPVLVLPLHGHLAPAAWAAAQAQPGSAGRLRADRRRGAAGLALAATSPSCASAACSAATSPPAPAYGGEHEALSTVGALDAADRLGWDAVLVGPGPGIIGSDTEFGHGGMAALDSAHAALSLGLPTLISPRLSSARPPRAPPSASATTPTPSSSCCSPRSTSPSPRARPRVAAALEAGRRGDRHRLRDRARRPRRLRRLGPARPRTMGRTPRGGPTLLRRPARRGPPARR